MSSLIISRPFRLEPQFERRPIQFYALFEMNRARIKLVHLIDIYEMKIPIKLSAEEQCFLKWRWNNLTCKSNLNLNYLRMLLHKEHLFWSVGSGIKVWPFPILWPNLPPRNLDLYKLACTLPEGASTEVNYSFSDQFVFGKIFQKMPKKFQ